jgi:hypothetical protein
MASAKQEVHKLLWPWLTVNDECHLLSLRAVSSVSQSCANEVPVQPCQGCHKSDPTWVSRRLHTGTSAKCAYVIYVVLSRMLFDMG